MAFIWNSSTQEYLNSKKHNFTGQLFRAFAEIAQYSVNILAEFEKPTTFLHWIIKVFVEIGFCFNTAQKYFYYVVVAVSIGAKFIRQSFSKEKKNNIQFSSVLNQYIVNLKQLFFKKTRK